MITNTQIRNALTGALAIMALGLFVSCSDTLVAPADDALDVNPQYGALAQDSGQGCSMVEGLWVCSAGGLASTNGDPPQQHCEFIGGVLHCEPVGGD